MSYISIKKPPIRVATIQLNTAGVSVSDSSPIVALPSLTWQTTTSGTATLATNEITLTAGKKYLLQATLSWNGIWNWSNDRLFRFYNETSAAWIGKPGICFSGYEAFSGVALYRIDEAARAIVAPASSTDVTLRYSGTTTQTFTVGDRPSGTPWNYLTDYGRVEVWEFDQ